MKDKEECEQKCGVCGKEVKWWSNFNICKKCTKELYEEGVVEK